MNENILAKFFQWGCLFFLTVSLILVALSVGWLFLRTPPLPPGPLPTAILWTATVTPTATPTPVPSPTLPPPTPTPSAGMAVGARVRVNGTGDVGLNLRAGPGLTHDRVDVALEGEVFIIVAGPTQADEITWWQLRAEADPTREGWAAANYLAPDSE